MSKSGVIKKALLLWLCVPISGTYAQRTLVPSDCVQIKYTGAALSGTDQWHAVVVVSPNGTQVAYLVKVRDLQRNANHIQLFVKTLSDMSRGNGRLVVIGDDISHIKWQRDGRHITMLMRIDGVVSVVEVEVSSGETRVLTKTNADIAAYDVDAQTRTIVFATTASYHYGHTFDQKSPDENADGYRIDFQSQKQNDAISRSVLFVVRRDGNDAWSSPQKLLIRDPFTSEVREEVKFISSQMMLSLSPDGSRIVFNQYETLPQDWLKDSALRRFMSASNSAVGISAEILVQYDLTTGQTTVPLKSVGPRSNPLWSADSRSFLVNSPAPIDSEWEIDDARADRKNSSSNIDLFAVSADSRAIDEVFAHVPPQAREGPLAWRDDGDVVIHVSLTVVMQLHRGQSTWRPIKTINVPVKKGVNIASVASDGDSVVGLMQSLSIPPELFVFHQSDNAWRLLTELNPQLSALSLARIETVHWTTSDGRNITGALFLPVGYKPGKRYPLVIQTEDYTDFACDVGYGGNHNEPSYAPQPIANAGMMYLIATKREESIRNRAQARERHPMGVEQVLQEMDVWESAVRELNSERLIDPNKIGILGFSHRGLYVEFMLAHSKIRFAAATVANNDEYTIGEYLLGHPGDGSRVRQRDEWFYGGPPFGKTLKNWLDYSTSFNLDKFRTPLLIETMGWGAHDDTSGVIPVYLAQKLEVFVGLNLVNKPVEMYYYPDEDHQPDHPRARLATLQRNLDWYCFWLQGYERPDPEDPDQYARWRHLRDLYNGAAELDRHVGR